MLKKTLVLMVLMLFLFQGVASAASSSGRIILEDTLYGLLIGGILGGAWYLLDEEDLGDKVGTGVAVGAIAGFVLGVVDATSFVMIDDGGVKFAMPAVIMEKRAESTVYRANLLSVRF